MQNLHPTVQALLGGLRLGQVQNVALVQIPAPALQPLRTLFSSSSSPRVNVCLEISGSKLPQSAANYLVRSYRLDDAHHAGVLVIEDMAVVDGSSAEVVERDSNSHGTARRYVHDVLPDH